MNFNNFILNLEQLQQARLDKAEGVVFRGKIENQSIFDGVVGSLFLLALAYRLGVWLWGYIEKNWLEPKRGKRSIKKQESAHELCEE